MRMAWLLIASALPLAAQAAIPQYALAFGGAYNYYSTPRLASGWLSIAVRLGSTNNYSFSTMDLTPSPVPLP
jgi:hypothetical protein